MLWARPLIGAARMNEVDVTDFGAVAGDGKDDTAAVLAAIEQCRKSLPATLVFPKGRYDFFAGGNPQNKGTLFPIGDMNGLTIDGRGSEFLMHGSTALFWFGNCKGLGIRDFIVDWDRPPFSLGKVIAAEGNHFDVEVFPEYPVKGGEPVGAFMDYDPKTRLPIRLGLDEYYTAEKTELLREQVLRVHLKHEARIKPGVLALLRHQVYGPSALVCSRCTDVSVKDVTVHTVPGMGFIGSVCTNITLERFKVMPRPGSGHIMSATADATHFSGCKGLIRMDGCEYEGMGDDGVNIKSGLYLSLRRRVDEHTIEAQHNLKMVDAPDPGDVMEISHVDDLLPYATAKVTKVEVLPNDNTHKVEFEEPLPAELREGDVFGNATRTPRVRITNCEVRNNRARGMLIQTRDAVVEKCRFRNCTGPGIMVLTEVVYFFESIGTRDVTIRDCLFEHVNYSAATGPGALCSMAYLKDFKFPPKPGVHRNVTFEGNTIRGTNNSGIFITGTDGVVLRRNRIELACEIPTMDTGSDAIHVMTSRNVTIEGNRIEPKDQGKGFKQAVGFGEGVETSRSKD
jgi:parallel beta-helix repeat protein